MREFLEGEISLGELEPKEKLDALFEFLSSLPDRTTRKDIFKMFPNMTEYQINQVIRILDFSGFLRVWVGVIEKTPKAKEIERKGYFEIEDFTEAPLWVRRTLTRRAIKMEIYIGDDSITGYDIYYNYLRKEYVLRSGKMLIKRFKDLGIALTFSIETEGHQTLACEVASWTFVSKMHPKNFDGIKNDLAKFSRDVVFVYFGIRIDEETIKAGVEYLSEPGLLTIVEASVDVDLVKWEEAKCVVEYAHGKYTLTPEGRLEFVRGTPKRIEVLKSEFYAKNPELIPIVFPREKQASLISFKT